MGKEVEKNFANIVVVGGSEGTIEALLEIVPYLTADMPAAVFIVVHISAEAHGYLPRILTSRGTLEARHPVDGETIRAGHIYVAPPNHHLTLKAGAVQVRKGPRENRHRPAIDPLFRTAARAFGPRVVALVLSGNLDDGSAGLLAVRARGGLAIVQAPGDARACEMPQRALNYAGADYVLPLREIGPKLIELINSREITVGNRKEQSQTDREVRDHEQAFVAGQGRGEPSVFACPECHGVLWKMEDGNLVRYRCRVGHSYTEVTLQRELGDSAEAALWAAMRALEEKAAMNRRMLNAASGPPDYLQRLKDQIEADTQNAEIIRTMIFAQD